MVEMQVFVKLLLVVNLDGTSDRHVYGSFLAVIIQNSSSIYFKSAELETFEVRCGGHLELKIP